MPTMKVFAAIYERVCRYPRLVLMCALALTILAATQLPKLDINLSLSQRFMGGPAVRVYDEFIRTFGPEPTLLVLADVQNGSVWDTAHGEQLKKFAWELGRVAGVDEVVSIVGVPGFDMSSEQLRSLPFVKKRLVSRDERATLFIVKTAPDVLGPHMGAQLTRKVERMARDHSQAGIVFSVSGPLALQTAAIDHSRRDLFIVTIIALLAISLLLGLAFRSASAVAGPLAVAVMTVVMTLGILAVAGITLSQFALIAVPVLVGLSVLDGVHIVHAWCESSQQGKQGQQGKNESEEVFLAGFAGLSRFAGVIDKELIPCTWTSLTTLIGFVVLVTAPLAQVRSIGLVIAIGVPLSFILSFTFLPSFLTLAAPRMKTLSDPFVRWSAGLARFVARRRKAIVVTAVVVTLVASLGMFRLHMVLDFPKLFRNNVPAQVAIDTVQERFGSSASFELMLSTDHSQGFLSPEIIQQVARLNTALRLSANVASTISYLDVGLAGAFANGVDLAKLKMTPVAGARLLETVTSTEAGRAIMAQWLTDDAKRARLHIALSSERPELFERLQLALTNLQRGFSDVMTIVPTGFAYLYKSMERVIMESFVRTFAYALIGIVIVLLVISRGFKRGLASVAANLMPLGIVLGLMGWLGVGVSVGVVILPAVGLGLLADDTIHFIMALKRGDSVESAYRSSGWPIVLTQLILLAAFGSLVASHFASNVTLAIFMCLLLVIGLAFDLLFIPAVISLKKSNISAK